MIWTPKTNYYIELPIEALKEVIDEILKSIVGYNIEDDLMFEDIIKSPKYLKNGNIAVNVQCINPMYMKERCTLGWITSEDLDLAEYYFQTDIFLTEQQYKDLEPIDNINN